VGLVITFFCLFVCFFLYVSLLALFPPYSFIWHLRVPVYVNKERFKQVPAGSCRFLPK
jgi:hypothetical protein